MCLHQSIAAGVVVSILAIGGCNHATHAANATPSAAPALAVAQPCNPSVSQSAQGPLYGESLDQPYLSERYMESIHRPVVVEEQPVTVPAVYTPYAAEPAYLPRPRSPVHHRTYYRRTYVYRRHRRSKKKSAAIVIGSAAAGAGIGALAGGGKGAAIGAATAGAGGFIYDRLTHNHH